MGEFPEWLGINELVFKPKCSQLFYGMEILFALLEFVQEFFLLNLIPGQASFGDFRIFVNEGNNSFPKIFGDVLCIVDGHFFILPNFLLFVLQNLNWHLHLHI